MQNHKWFGHADQQKDQMTEVRVANVVWWVGLVKRKVGGQYL